MIYFMGSSYFWYCSCRLKIWLKMIGFSLWDPYLLLGLTINGPVMSFLDMCQLMELLQLPLELRQLPLELLLVFLAKFFLLENYIFSPWFYYNTFLVYNKLISWYLMKLWRFSLWFLYIMTKSWEVRMAFNTRYEILI